MICCCATLRAASQQLITMDGYPPQDTARVRWMLTKTRTKHQRPQMPHPPYHYTIEDCTFTGKKTGLTYGATLTRPIGIKRFPTVVLISGTGSQDRDYTVSGHKFFWVLADYLSNHGIAVLRVDDRSTGKTTGIFNRSTTVDFAKDVLCAVEWLNTRKDIDPGRIGLIGHSEGGIVAPMVAAMAPEKISFLVMIGAPVIGLHQINYYQTRQAYTAIYKPDTVLFAMMRLHQEIMSKIPAQAHDLSEMNVVVKNALDTFYKRESPGIVKRIIPDKNTYDRMFRSYQSFLSPWWQFVLSYDPAQDIQKVNCPVLVVYGNKDRQVPPAEDYALIKKLQHRRSESILIPDMNHFMQPDTSGNPKNYEAIETTIKPVLLEKISTWVLGQAQLGR
ncbi:hypothetical protein SAMN05443550_106150 [Pedobacter hartonius]|uniref:Xaa-Pro dipeptidyl-peptidase-like domain-containing protein n=2 Tax=Pedobacter hartonius TaxID=425514 RepID=A0A1H4ETP2_9SPHI|nr:hypothetical protein SAMN05443550_106150 [Pedobacter hartonius]